MSCYGYSFMTSAPCQSYRPTSAHSYHAQATDGPLGCRHELGFTSVAHAVAPERLANVLQGREIKWVRVRPITHTRGANSQSFGEQYFIRRWTWSNKLLRKHRQGKLVTVKQFVAVGRWRIWGTCVFMYVWWLGFGLRGGWVWVLWLHLTANGHFMIILIRIVTHWFWEWGWDILHPIPKVFATWNWPWWFISQNGQEEKIRSGMWHSYNARGRDSSLEYMICTVVQDTKIWKTFLLL